MLPIMPFGFGCRIARISAEVCACEDVSIFLGARGTAIERECVALSSHDPRLAIRDASVGLSMLPHLDVERHSYVQEYRLLKRFPLTGLAFRNETKKTKKTSTINSNESRRTASSPCSTASCRRTWRRRRHRPSPRRRRRSSRIRVPPPSCRSPTRLGPTGGGKGAGEHFTWGGQQGRAAPVPRS